MAKKKDIEVEETDQELNELQADLQRVQADFVNYRRRAEADRAEIMALAKQEVVMQTLPLLDNLGRALGHLPEGLQTDPWAIGVQQVAKQADEVLKSLGVERIEAVGQPFDPHLHEAIAHDGDGDLVTEELQPGYRLGDRVIRHAIVKVGGQS